MVNVIQWIREILSSEKKTMKNVNFSGLIMNLNDVLAL